MKRRFPSLTGRPIRFVSAGNSGSIRAHSRSLNSCRCTALVDQIPGSRATSRPPHDLAAAAEPNGNGDGHGSRKWGRNAGRGTGRGTNTGTEPYGAVHVNVPLPVPLPAFRPLSRGPFSSPSPAFSLL